GFGRKYVFEKKIGPHFINPRILDGYRQTIKNKENYIFISGNVNANKINVYVYVDFFSAGWLL
ncbi:MAG: hypothetical protein ACOCUC_00090, partial [bacterium]